MVVFGGLDETHGPLDDLWQYCVSSRWWTELTPKGGQHAAWPAARHQHTLTALSAPPSSGSSTTSTHLLLFGGLSRPASTGASPLIDDGAWLYSLRSGTWLRLHSPPGGARPSARLGHSALALSPRVAWLFGGLAGEGDGPAGGEDGPLGGGGRPTIHAADDLWLLPLPDDVDDATDACSGCSEHGACDLRLRRCVCDPPWGGDACDVLQAAGVPEAPRRAISGLLWLSGSMVLGVLLGWVSRGRGLVREAQERARAEARERRYRAGAMA